MPIKVPYEATVINRKDLKNLKGAGFSAEKSDEQDWYESKKIFDLADVIDFEQTYFANIEPKMEAIIIESQYRYTFTIKGNYAEFKALMQETGMIPKNIH